MGRLRTLIYVAILIFTFGSTPGAAAPTNFDPEPFLHAQHLVDIGGRRLNLYCVGSGSPTVVLDTGLGGTTADWSRVQARIAHTTRVCSYDRAGMGFSDPAPAPRNAGTAVSDLHVLLQRAGIPPPYVLVGHSIAGLYDRLYADRFPGEVAGMVLVDPSYPHQIQEGDRIYPGYARFIAEDRITLYRRCESAAEKHLLVAGSATFTACGLLTPAQLRKVCAADGPAMCKIDILQNEQQALPTFWQAVALELSTFSTTSSAQVAREQRNYGAMPLIVLTAGRGQYKDLLPHVTAAQESALAAGWKGAHDRIAALSAVGVNFIIPDSTHYIQIDRPSVVVSAVDEVVAQAR